ncbi:MAG: KamA family radical SAM protein [bacterium]|nr:KamA family radical SAM protein [bacterium]
MRSVAELEHYLLSKKLSLEQCALTYLRTLPEVSLSLRIPTAYADLINWTDINDPLRKIVVPSEAEMTIQPYEVLDPIGDAAREVVPGLIHRYPDRVLLLLTSYCLVHCRFCFRKEVVGKVRPVAFTAMRQYLTQHTEVRELIFSGGDPFTFPVGFLESMIEHFSSLKHVTTWRFHTRIPAVDPQAVTEEFLHILGSIEKMGIKVIVVIHIDHPRELTSNVQSLITKLREQRILVLSQTVLLREVNDSAETLLDLFRKLTLSGVMPYYLHHLDQAPGTHHFRVSIEQGKRLFQSLRGQTAGYALPEYVLDLPGGQGKVPVMWLKKIGESQYQVTNFEGKTITYHDHATEA